jgi:hypothetical protein
MGATPRQRTATSRQRTARERKDQRNDRHHAAIVAAELRRIERRLREVGPMPRRALSAQCGESSWRDGNVTEAVREGIRQHRLKELPFGWIAPQR